MASINDLNLTNDAVELPEEVPEQFGTFTPPPQPGPYRLRLPSNLGKIWDLVDVRSEVVKKKLGGADKALIASFSDDFPLIITQSRGDNVGEAFLTRIQVAPRHRGNDVYVSDMYYFLDKGLGHDMEGCRKWTQKEWAAALMKHPGQEFAASIEWSAFCNPDRVRYISDDEGTSIEDPSGTSGCGANYYTSKNQVPKEEDGSYAFRFECTECKNEKGTPAVLRCFANLTNFRVVTKD